MHDQHLSAERLQAFLEGDLPGGERHAAEGHLTACAHCSAELDAWRTLFGDLGELHPVAPAPGFAERVMAGVRVGGTASLAGRVRSRLASLVPAPRPRHVSPERLQDFLEGLLPARQMARVEAHVGACATCAAEADQWRTLAVRLATLERLSPREGFADAVLARVTLPSAQPVSAARRVPAPARPGALGQAAAAALALGRRVVPRTRRAWAALAGVAVTPAVTAGLVIYTVFSHPTLTPQALASFVVWKGNELLAAGWTTLVTGALSAAQVTGLGALLQSLIDAPAMLAGGALAYSALSVLALRVLYKNLIAGRRHVRVSPS